jgi:DNA polymerase-3 subunit delta
MYSKKKTDRSFNVFLREMKDGSIGNVVLMSGREQYLVKWAVDMIRKKYVDQATEAMDYAVLDEDAATVENIIETCQTFSMLSEKRVIWVRDFRPLKSKHLGKGYTEESLEELTGYIEDPNEAAMVIFSSEELDESAPVVKALKKKGTCYEFVALSDRELQSFAGKRFREAGLRISTAAMNHLLRSTGYGNSESDYRLYNFENDIRKIIAHAEGGVITEADIDSAVAGDNDTFIFDLIDGISGNNKKVALEVLYNKLHANNYDAVPITAAIISQIELMLEVKEFLLSERGPKNAEAINKYTGINVYRIRKVMKYCGRYSLEKLREMLKGIYETYANILTGILEPQLALELFIAQI